MPLVKMAHEIYKERYWDKLRLDQVCAIAGARDEIFDTAVNQGAGITKYLQRSLNALNQRGTFNSDDATWMATSGSCSGAALRTFLRLRGVPAPPCYCALNAPCGAFYIELNERREGTRTFVCGWLSNRINSPPERNRVKIIHPHPCCCCHRAYVRTGLGAGAADPQRAYRRHGPAA